MSGGHSFSTMELARRLERAEALGCAGFAGTRARLHPDCGSTCIEVAGATVVYDGINSPVTQCFGLGVHDDVTDDHLDEIERFYRERHAPVHLEISPLAGVPLAQRLVARGYTPVEFSSVMVMEIAAAAPRPASHDTSVSVRIVKEHEADLWAETTSRGWSEQSEYADLIRALMNISARRTDELNFLAEIDGTPVAAGALMLYDGVALLGGASTVPEFRRRGAQGALLDARLAHAASNGCDIAMVCTEPGSASQRNAERNGFRIAYTRTKWMLETTESED